MAEAEVLDVAANIELVIALKSVVEVAMSSNSILLTSTATTKYGAAIMVEVVITPPVVSPCVLSIIYVTVAPVVRGEVHSPIEPARQSETNV